VRARIGRGLVAAYFCGFAAFEFRLRSVRSLSRPKARLLVKVIQGNEMHRNTEETACDLLLSRIGELDGRDFGQNINAHGSNSNLVDHLLSGECFCIYPILI
jgi:hypothetical protein